VLCSFFSDLFSSFPENRATVSATFFASGILGAGNRSRRQQPISSGENQFSAGKIN